MQGRRKGRKTYVRALDERSAVTVPSRLTLYLLRCVALCIGAAVSLSRAPSAAANLVIVLKIEGIRPAPTSESSAVSRAEPRCPVDRAECCLQEAEVRLQPIL
jgi:hypothetical protein